MKRKFLKILITSVLIIQMLLSNTTKIFAVSNNIKNVPQKQIVMQNKKINNIQLETVNSMQLRTIAINEIILHHSASENNDSVEDINKMHLKRGWSTIGYNFYIDKDGNIFKGRDLKYLPAHTLGRNMNSIGICLSGNFNETQPTQQQMESLLFLTVQLSKEYNIKNISKHSDYNEIGTPTDCPGKNFPYDSFMNMYKVYMNN